MALVACPKCKTKLQLPDGAAGAVRCPKCQTAFRPPKPAAAPAFEVVDDEPPKPAKPAPPRPSGSVAPPAARPAPKPAPKPAPEDDFEVVDDEPTPPPKKKVVARAADDEDDDRPRKKKRRDDEDEDRPRKKRRDEDEDDDLPRGRRRDREDDEDDDRPRKKKRVPGASAKTALLLSSISLGLYFATFALIALFVFLAWVGVGYIPLGVMILPGILGLANWVVGGIGFGFAIAGPPKARGLAIAALAVSVIHLALSFVVANNTDAGMFSNYTTQALGIQNKHDRITRLAEDAGKNPSAAKTKEIEEAQKELQQFTKDYKEEEEEVGYFYLRRLLADDKELNAVAPKAMRWQDLASLLPFFDQLVGNLAFHGKRFGEYVLPMLGGLVEVARLVLLVLLVGSLARAVKGDDAADKAKFGLISVCAGVGLAVLISLLVAVMVDSAKSDLKKAFEGAVGGGDIGRTDPADLEKKFKAIQEKAKSAMQSLKHWPAVGALLNSLIFAGMVVMPALVAVQAMGAASRAARW